jgi:lipoprotein NlpI/transglutaminase-like putative cysteine protease
MDVSPHALMRHVRTLLTLVSMLLLGGFCPPAGAAAKAPAPALKYLVAKTPSWVVKVAEPASPTVSPADGGPTQVLLSDVQVSLLGPKPIYYGHLKSQARERSGLESVSTVRITFNPHFETLTLHDLSVLRDGKRMSKFGTARIDVAQRERRLEEGVYDETAQAIIAVDDVRVGDIVEYAYSLAGDNPVFGGKYSQFFALNRDVPVAKVSVRVSCPAVRKLQYKLHGSSLPVSEIAGDGIKTLTLAAENLPLVRAEPSVPSWILMYPALQVTEYESWQQLQQWATGLYKTPSDLSPAIGQVLDGIRAEGGTPHEMAARTLAWVQNQIRYYSVAVGTSSHRPNHPNVTFQQRFGDCKDKSVLLSAMLKKLGIDAEPALVSYQMQKGIGDWLPTPWAFDHVIVQVRIDGRSYWLDGTQTYQGTRLERLGFTPFGKALPTETPTDRLVDVIAPPEARSESQLVQTLNVTSYGAPTEMVMEQKYFGSYAEWFRRRIAADGLTNFLDTLQTEYGRDFPNISRHGDPTVADDPAGNVIALKQVFEIPKLFTYDKGRAKTSVYATSIVPVVRFPRTPERKFPLALPYPAAYNERIVLNLPHKLDVPAPAPESWQDRHVVMTNSIRAGQNGVAFDYGFRVLEDNVPVAAFAAYSEKMKQAFSMLFSSASIPITDSTKLRTRIARELEKAGANLRDPDQGESMRQNALRDYAVADEAIRGKLLSGPLLAQAYRDLAEAESLLGRRDEALADIDRALSLDASESAYILKAEIQIYARRYREALETLSHAVQDAGKASTQSDFGIANYYLGNYGEAQRSFARAADAATPEELPYALIWLAVASRKAGYQASDVLEKYRSRLSGAWPAEGVALVLGESAPDKIIAAAKQDDKESRTRLCEAYFYLGQKALLDGNLADAKHWFSKSVDTNIVMYREHILAQHELSRLGR